jgi:carboxyl-terminal processing protease
VNRWLASFVALGASVVVSLAAQATKAAETFDAAWMIVRDSHFDRTLNGVDWEAVKTELRPRAAVARTDGELRAVLRDMLGRLGQSHFALIPSGADTPATPAGDLRGHPGFEVRLIAEGLVVTRVSRDSGAEAAGVRTGWMLASIGGKPVAELLKGLPDLPDRLRHVEIWRLVESRVRGPLGTRVSVVFENGTGQSTPLDVERRLETGLPAVVGTLPPMPVRLDTEVHRTPRGGTAGVIHFNVWMPAVDPLFQNAVDRFRTHDGIIVDLRGNPGGLAAMVMGISGHFLTDRSKPLGTMKTRESELKFPPNPRLVSAAGERVEPFKGPVAILVDAMTGSASECFAGGMQSLGRARVFGQTSMGQALPALFDKLPNGDVLIHAYGDFLTADGTRLEGRGVIPNEKVALRRDELLAGRDATLEAALAWVDATRSQAGGRAPIALAGPALLDSIHLRPAVFSSPSPRGNNRGN